MNIPLSVGDYKGRSGASNAQRMVNMMVEADTEGGASPYSLAGTPGLKEYVDLGIVAIGRGGYSLTGIIICIVGTHVFTIDTDTKVKTDIGSVLTSTGAIQWGENPTQLMFIDGTYGYVYTKATQTMAQITDLDFPTPLSCTVKDGYGTVVEASTGKLYVSGLNDLTAWDALAFTTAEYEPDNLVACLASHDSLFAFGVKTTQTYYNSGNSTFPFDNRPGANMQIGCGATGSPAKGENIVLWLDNKGLVRKLDGYTQTIISTRQIDYKIAQLSTFADAEGYVYSQEGHTFYVLIFPTDGLTLVYDMATGLWHERTSGALSTRWRAAWIIQEGSLIIAGDYTNGKVYQLDPATYTDNLNPIKWEFTLQDINNDMHMIVHSLLELQIESGVGVATGQGSDPQLFMQYSDDDGQTWSHEKWRSMGKIGEFKKRVKFFSLGQSRSRVYKISGTDPVKRQVVSARLEGRVLGY